MDFAFTTMLGVPAIIIILLLKNTILVVAVTLNDFEIMVLK